MSSAYGQNNRTLNLDTLFVRDIVFKDFANNPIPANQPLVSRGDGGTYFTSSFSSTIALPAINAITTSTVTGPYQFAPIGAFNTFSLNPGAGMEFYSNAENGGLIIYNIGPEQIIADGQVLSFTDLPDYTVGGRTLQYVGTGDTSLQVSDATIFFNSIYNSSLSTVAYLENQLNSSLSVLNGLITSSGLYNYNLISSYFLKPNVINISTVSTSLLVLGDNYIKDTPLRDSIYDPCIVVTGSTILSTNTDFLTFTDNFSGVTFAIDKEFLFGSSTLKYGPSTTTVTRGQQVQLGWFPTLSTQTNTQSLRAQFVPVVQQIQVLEQLVSTGSYLGGGLYSTTTNYYMKNIGRFDEICNPTKISLISPVIAATLRYDNTVNNSWIQYDTATSTIVWGTNGGSGSLQSGSNYGDYAFWNGSAWETGFSTISIGDQAGGGFVTAEGQGEAAIAIGAAAGYSTQGAYAVALGYTAGQYAQSSFGVAIGYYAGNYNQGFNAIAIGSNAGSNTQEQFAIAIGAGAGQNDQSTCTIVLNATGFELNTVQASSFYVAPIRYDSTVTTSFLQYNTVTNEVVWNTGTSTMTQSLIPDVDNAYDIGTSTLRLRHLYVGPSSLTIGTGSISADNGGNLFATNEAGDTVAIGGGGGGGGSTTDIYSTLYTSSLTASTINGIEIYTSSLTVSSINGMQFTGPLATENFCVTVGFGPNYLAYSYDGLTWTPTPTANPFIDNSNAGIFTNWNGSLWISGGYDDTTSYNTLACSSDGIHWLSGEGSAFDSYFTCAAWNGTMWIGGGLDAFSGVTLASSYDGIYWTPIDVGLFSVCLGIAWNGTMWVAVGVGVGVGNGILYSYDGFNWTSANVDYVGQCVAWNGKMWVVGTVDVNAFYETIFYSYDGINWNLANSSLQKNCYCIAWNGSVWVAGAGEGPNNPNPNTPYETIAYSTDGINWSLSESVFEFACLSVAWNGSIFVVTGDDNVNSLGYSYNGDLFFPIANSVFSPGPYGGYGVSSRRVLPYVGTSPVAAVVKNVTENFCLALCPGYNKLAYSYDGLNWNGLGAGPFSVDGNGICAAWNGTVWIVGGYDDGSSYHTMGISSDGINWTSLSGESPFQNRCNTVVWNGSIWVAGGEGVNTLAFSLDGRNWTGLGTSIFDTSCRTLAWNGSIFVAGGGDAAPGSANTLASSIDGFNWQVGGNGVFTTFCDSIAWNGSIWVGGGYGTNKLGYSYDGINWTGLGGTVFNTIGFAVAWNGSIWLAAGSHNGDSKIASSYDGITWSTAATGLPAYGALPLAWNGSVWIAGGSNSVFYSLDGTNWTEVASSVVTSPYGIASRIILPYVGSSPIPFTRMSTIAYGTGAGLIGQGLNAVAIGYYAGLSTQGVYSIAVGTGAGLTCQGSNAVAVGAAAGLTYQSTNAVAIGAGAGQDYQGPNSVAIGTAAGLTYQGSNAVAVGFSAGITYQSDYSIAMGYLAGSGYQSTNAIAIGYSAGNTSQGAYTIALGAYAGLSNQHDNTIVLNATGVDFNTIGSNSFYVSPIRSDVGASNGNLLYYDTGTGEIIYDTTKTFVINHPKDESKYLVHACLEGPEAGVYYRGTGTIAELETSVEVELPDYVDALAVDLTVQVTPIYNGSVRVLNASCVSNNKFTVYGDSGDFWWHVYGRRASVVVEPKKSSVSVLGEGPYRWIA